MKRGFMLKKLFFPFIKWLKNILSLFYCITAGYKILPFFFCLWKSICTHSSCAHTDNQSVSFKQKKYELPYIDRNRVFRSYKRK